MRSAVIAISAAALALIGAGAGATRASAPKPLGWVGKITFTTRHHFKHTNLAGDSVTQDSTATYVLTQTGRGTASIEASYDFKSVETYFHCNTLSGVKVSTENGSETLRDDPARVSRDSRTHYTISAPTVTVKTKSEYSAKAPGCANSSPDDEGSSSDSTENIGPLPMAGALKPGIVRLSGSASDNRPGSGNCGQPGYECADSETVTWGLSRPKVLSIQSVKLYDRDPFWSTRTKDEKNKHIFPKEFVPLAYLSTSDHGYFKQLSNNGHTPVNPIYGTVTLDGFSDDSVTSLSLEVENEDGATATAGLAGSSSGDVLRSFENGPVKVDQKQLLFVLPASEAAKLDRAQADNQELSLRVVATSDWGDRTSKSLGKVEQLVQYELGNRYGQDDPLYGGDHWMTPETRRDITWITNHASIKFSWGDASNMNGGRFYPHLSHDKGKDVDGSFADFYEEASCDSPFKRPNAHCTVTQYAGIVLVQLLRSAIGKRIQNIFVTYEPWDWDPRGRTLEGVLKHADGDPLPDGRLPSEVIRPWPSHDTHFHIRFKR